MAVFEAPAAHETAYSNPEWEAEWESHESPYSSPEMEWETHESHYSPEAEWESHEAESHYSPEMEWESPESEWESHESHFSTEAEAEAEFLGNILSSLGGAIGLESGSYEAELEYEDEGELFFGKLIKRIGRTLGPIAKKLAPMAARALAGMIPGVGAIAGPLAGQLVGSLVKEAEYEVEALEAEFFGANEMEAEVGYTETAHEAALTELMAAEAAEAATESEAESVLGATLPITITIMGGRRALRPVFPTMAQASGRLVKTLAGQGPAGRQLLRAVPSIQRQAVATLKAAARQGQPITTPVVVKAMASAARSVLGNPRRASRIVERNLVLRRRMGPPSPRRAAVFVPNRMPPFNPRRTRRPVREYEYEY